MTPAGKYASELALFKERQKPKAPMLLLSSKTQRITSATNEIAHNGQLVAEVREDGRCDIEIQRATGSPIKLPFDVAQMGMLRDYINDTFFKEAES